MSRNQKVFYLNNILKNSQHFVRMNSRQNEHQSSNVQATLWYMGLQSVHC